MMCLPAHNIRFNILNIATTAQVIIQNMDLWLSQLSGNPIEDDVPPFNFYGQYSNKTIVKTCLILPWLFIKWNNVSKVSSSLVNKANVGKGMFPQGKLVSIKLYQIDCEH